MFTWHNLSIKAFHFSKTSESQRRVGTLLSMLRLKGMVCSSSVITRGYPAMITLSILSGTIRELAAVKISWRPY
jgi:hypothetical protein